MAEHCEFGFSAMSFEVVSCFEGVSNRGWFLARSYARHTLAYRVLFCVNELCSPSEELIARFYKRLVETINARIALTFVLAISGMQYVCQILF